MTVLYEIMHYETPEEFNTDALARYNSTMKARTAISYDAFWRVEQVTKLSSSGFSVLWSRPAPLRTR